MDVYRVGAIGGAIAATVQVPGSKSVANRALVCAALAQGTTVLLGAGFAPGLTCVLAALGRIESRHGKANGSSLRPDGRTTGADVVSSSGYPLLDRAARDAVKTWRFLPAFQDGRPVPSDLTMRFVFDDQ